MSRSVRYVFTLEWMQRGVVVETLGDISTTSLRVDLDEDKVIWLKNNKYQLVIECEIIKGIRWLLLARLSSKQYERLDGRLVLKLNTERYEANKATLLPSLTYWLGVHVARWQCVYPIVLHSIHFACHYYFLSIDLGYPLTFYIFLATWSRASWSWNSVSIVCQHLTLPWCLDRYFRF